MVIWILALGVSLPAAADGPEDDDNDGYFEGIDCDDDNAAVNPGAAERCDGIDNNCDGVIDVNAVDAPTWYDDDDGDGDGGPLSMVACARPPGTVATSGDCNDADLLIGPSAAETCNGIDDDCDGDVDGSSIDAIATYVDADGDGFGAGFALTTCPDSASVLRDGDCNDADPNIHPGVDDDVVNGVDDDCDGTVDVTTPAVTDADGDGFDTTSDCDDADPLVNDGAVEVCNGVDDDCDGSIDTNAANARSWFVDGDADGHGAGPATPACTMPTGSVALNDDCNDTDPLISPTAVEIPANGTDDDCDGFDAAPLPTPPSLPSLPSPPSSPSSPSLPSSPSTPSLPSSPTLPSTPSPTTGQPAPATPLPETPVPTDSDPTPTDPTPTDPPGEVEVPRGCTTSGGPVFGWLVLASLAVRRRT